MLGVHNLKLEAEVLDYGYCLIHAANAVHTQGSCSNKHKGDWELLC